MKHGGFWAIASLFHGGSEVEWQENIEINHGIQQMTTVEVTKMTNSNKKDTSQDIGIGHSSGKSHGIRSGLPFLSRGRAGGSTPRMHSILQPRPSGDRM